VDILFCDITDFERVYWHLTVNQINCKLAGSAAPGNLVLNRVGTARRIFFNDWFITS